MSAPNLRSVLLVVMHHDRRTRAARRVIGRFRYEIANATEEDLVQYATDVAVVLGMPLEEVLPSVRETAARYRQPEELTETRRLLGKRG